MRAKILPSFLQQNDRPINEAGNIFEYHRPKVLMKINFFGGLNLGKNRSNDQSSSGSLFDAL